MMRRICAIATVLCLALPGFAQDFSGLARVDMAQSSITDRGRGLSIDLSLTQTVPYRVFTLTEPNRLVVDFREVDWTGVSRAALLNADAATDLRFGTLRPGWSRMIVTLATPMAIDTAGLKTDATTGTAALSIRLSPADQFSFAARAGAPDDAFIDNTPITLPAPTPDDGPTTVMIDPGHGGLDPGAERGTVQEADLMLRLAIEVTESLNRTGQIRALMTRDTDVFVPLEDRMSLARAARADLLISLHADALEQDDARGASVYTLNAEGVNAASQRMAERHERGDLLAGLDLTHQDDRVAGVLMDLARQDTGPASDRFADTLVQAMRSTGAELNSRPRRSARLAVLNAADFASVLIEAGFLSNAADRARLSTPEGRAPIVTAITQAVLTWSQNEAASAPLRRQ